ncbi:hypothetical protein KO489_10515 [Reinekea forsetii]|nr:hypothetical protein [Reinekea forsetii]
MKPLATTKTVLFSTILAISLAGCEQPGLSAAPEFDLDIPNSLKASSESAKSNAERMDSFSRTLETISVSAGEAGNTFNSGGVSARSGTGEPCSFNSVSDDDMFANGYNMTRFMVSAVSTWTCVADTLITLTDGLPHDGAIVATDNVKGTEGYEADEPTHYSVSDESDSQTTIRIYYGYDQELPPTSSDEAGFYLAWDSFLSDVSGKLIINSQFHDEVPESDDPVQMRLDFDFSESSKVADMYMKFDDANEWAEGYRIKVTKDLTAPLSGKVFEAQGLLAMTAQYVPVNGIEALPDLSVYTVANQLGDGAAVAQMTDLVLPLELTNTNHLGNYLTTKEDTYYFDSDSDWDYIAKTFTVATLEGGRTTAATGGTWLNPFDPSLDMIAAELELGSSYFTGSECAADGDNCVELINAVVEDGFANQEQNQGANPMDWRSTELMAPVYLDTVFPNGLNWDGAFDQVFYP